MMMLLPMMMKIAERKQKELANSLIKVSQSESRGRELSTFSHHFSVLFSVFSYSNIIFIFSCHRRAD